MKNMHGSTPCYPQCYAYYEIQEFYWSVFLILDLSETLSRCTWITYQNIYPVPCVLVYEDIFQKLEKTTREILWKQLEKIWKEPYHPKTQKIRNQKLSENGTVRFRQWAPARAVLMNFRLCNVKFRIR
jgi:hypothetical protein